MQQRTCEDSRECHHKSRTSDCALSPEEDDIDTMKFIESQEEWSALMEESKSKLVVVDFTASWCG